MWKSKRTYTNLLILISTFLLPWWITAVLTFASLWFFDFFEIIIFGFLIDLIYGSHPVFSALGGFWSHIRFPMALAGLILYGISLFIKKNVKFYSS